MFSGQTRQVTTFSLPLTGSHESPTFKSRGIAAPFTTPLLSGARVRESERIGNEIVATNPSGGRGVYVVRWNGVCALSSPTMHDTLLFQQLGTLGELTPRAARDMALKVALDGYAGQDALAAAKKTLALDRNQRQQAGFLMLQNLVNQVEPGKSPKATARTPEFDQHVDAVLERLAPSLRRTSAELAADVSAISDGFAPYGIGLNTNGARIPRLIDRLDDTYSAIFAWAKADADQEMGSLASAVGSSIRTAAKWGRSILLSTRSVLDDPLTLLARRISDPNTVKDLAERGDWLLDGWERVCLLWQVPSGVASRNVALLEMAQCLPALPQEAFQWANPVVPLQPPDQNCRVVSTDSRWHTGSSAIVMIERNEKLRAMSL